MPGSDELLLITLPHVLALQALPPLHRDPFDRLLIAQANVEGVTLVTNDPLIARYDVSWLF
jgi:PIN domain nuclease of toxin-antitoxin system